MEMDAYLISQLYKQWTSTDPNDEEKTAMTADTTALTTENILGVFDDLMLNMDEARVPANGRILYVTSVIKKMLKNAEKIGRSISVTDNNHTIDRIVSRLDEVEIISVPSTLMKTKYDFTKGWEIASDAEQINMMLVHPDAVITPVSYEMVSLDPPSAVTEGKYIYFEESFEDVFILNKKQDAIQFNVGAVGGDGDGGTSG